MSVGKTTCILGSMFTEFRKRAKKETASVIVFEYMGLGFGKGASHGDDMI